MKKLFGIYLVVLGLTVSSFTFAAEHTIRVNCTVIGMIHDDADLVDLRVVLRRCAKSGFSDANLNDPNIADEDLRKQDINIDFKDASFPNLHEFMANETALFAAFRALTNRAVMDISYDKEADPNNPGSIFKFKNILKVYE